MGRRNGRRGKPTVRAFLPRVAQSIKNVPKRHKIAAAFGAAAGAGLGAGKATYFPTPVLRQRRTVKKYSGYTIVEDTTSYSWFRGREFRRLQQFQKDTINALKEVYKNPLSNPGNQPEGKISLDFAVNEKGKAGVRVLYLAQKDVPQSPVLRDAVLRFEKEAQADLQQRYDAADAIVKEFMVRHNLQTKAQLNAYIIWHPHPRASEIAVNSAAGAISGAGTALALSIMGVAAWRKAKGRIAKRLARKQVGQAHPAAQKPNARAQLAEQPVAAPPRIPTAESAERRAAAKQEMQVQRTPLELEVHRLAATAEARLSGPQIAEVAKRCEQRRIAVGDSNQIIGLIRELEQETAQQEFESWRRYSSRGRWPTELERATGSHRVRLGLRAIEQRIDEMLMQGLNAAGTPQDFIRIAKAIRSAPMPEETRVKGVMVLLCRRLARAARSERLTEEGLRRSTLHRNDLAAPLFGRALENLVRMSWVERYTHSGHEDFYRFSADAPLNLIEMFGWERFTRESQRG